MERKTPELLVEHYLSIDHNRSAAISLAKDRIVRFPSPRTTLYQQTHTAVMVATVLRLAGLRIILSRVLTISAKRGRLLRSFCQQSSMSWWRAAGQSIGGGSRQSCSMALMTYITHIETDMTAGQATTCHSHMNSQNGSSEQILGQFPVSSFTHLPVKGLDVYLAFPPTLGSQQAGMTSYFPFLFQASGTGFEKHCTSLQNEDRN